MEDNLLSPENILSGADLENLFDDDFMKDNSSDEETKDIVEEDKENKENNTTTEVNPDELFSEEEPESVGSEENKVDREDPPQSVGSTSPKNFYSSIATALREEGVFPDLSDDDINNIKSDEDFKDFWNTQVSSQMDERYRRVEEALNYGIHPTEIQKYENTLAYLSNLNDEILSSEDEHSDQLRRALIVQDYINRGYSKEKATKELNKSIQAGTDIDDAKEALVGNLQYYQALYQDAVEEAREQQQAFIAQRDRQIDALRKSIENDTNFFGEIAADKKTRKKIFEDMAKPVYKDPDTGQMLTALQRYQKEHPVDFLKNVGIIYTLTKGFKQLDGLTNSKIKKGIKRGFKELEQTINNSARNPDGSLNYMSGTGEESIFRGFTLDI